jgi:hypothetical protein
VARFEVTAGNLQLYDAVMFFTSELPISAAQLVAFADFIRWRMRKISGFARQGDAEGTDDQDHPGCRQYC